MCLTVTPANSILNARTGRRGIRVSSTSLPLLLFKEPITVEEVHSLPTVLSFIGLALSLAKASAGCSGLTVDLKVKAPLSYAGHPITVSASVKNTGSTQLTNVGVGFYLPNGLCLSKSHVIPALKPKRGPVLEGNNVYWTAISLKAKRKVVFMVKTTVATNLTTATMLPVGSVAWLPEINCSTTSGPQYVSMCMHNTSSHLQGSVLRGSLETTTLHLCEMTRCVSAPVSYTHLTLPTKA